MYNLICAVFKSLPCDSCADVVSAAGLGGITTPGSFQSPGAIDFRHSVAFFRIHAEIQGREKENTRGTG